MENKFKTIHENKILINPPTESLVDKMQVLQLLNNMKNYILSLQRFDLETDEGGGWMQEAFDGEYIKLEEALKLFSTKK